MPAKSRRALIHAGLPLIAAAGVCAGATGTAAASVRPATSSARPAGVVLGAAAGDSHRAARVERAVRVDRAATSSARSGGTFQIQGAGDGHGLGMSQYGAAGYALHGWRYQAILAHYYQGTTLNRVANSTVTVLLNQGTARFRGATAANGHALSPTTSYSVVVSGSRLQLVTGGRVVGSFSAPLRVSTSTASGLDVAGLGDYAGSLVFSPDGSGGVDTVNAVDLEDYVRGVIAEEMPASWPQEALEAQAVAARSYVLASGAVSPLYDVYADTRSQMYGGISGETAATNAAESATAGQVVEAGGQVVPTYFSASSGGHTESIQNVWLGESPTSYLTGVQDPYDNSEGNPYYRWSDTLSLAAAAQSLSGLYRGTLEGIRILSHGVSPRIISARVVGTRGGSTVSGATLEEDLGTDSTWMSFTTVTATAKQVSSGTGAEVGAGASSGTSTPTTASGSSAPSSSSSGTGGAGLGDVARPLGRVVTGTVFPAVRGTRVVVQMRGAGGRWSTVATTVVTAAGRYAAGVFGAGTYRAVYDGAVAPSVTLR